MRIEYDVTESSRPTIHDGGFVGIPQGTLSCWFNGCGILGNFRLENNSKNLNIVKQALADYTLTVLQKDQAKLQEKLDRIDFVLEIAVLYPNDWLEQYRVPYDVMIARDKESRAEHSRWHYGDPGRPALGLEY